MPKSLHYNKEGREEGLGTRLCTYVAGLILLAIVTGRKQL